VKDGKVGASGREGKHVCCCKLSADCLALRLLFTIV